MNVTADRELVESLAGHPELLAIADAIADTQRRPANRRLARRAALLAATAVVAAAATLAAPWGDRGPGTLERALAALGSGQVLHAVVEWSGDDVVVDLRTGRERAVVHRAEYLYDADGRMFRSLLARDGVVTSEDVLTPTHAHSRTGTRPNDGTTALLPPPLAGFASGYRAALESGEAVEVGERTVQGRRARVLEFEQASGERTTVAVDAESYRPLELRSVYPGGRRSPVYVVREIELLRRRDGQFAPPEVGPPRPSVGGAFEPKELTLEEAATELRAAPLWLGSDGLAGAERSEVWAELSDGTRLEGFVVRLRYGRTTIGLARDRAGAIALGLEDLGRGVGPDALLVTHGWSRHDAWETTLRRGALAVSVSAPTKHEVVRAVRRLRPAP